MLKIPMDQMLEEMNVTMLAPLESSFQIVAPEKNETQWSKSKFKIRHNQVDVLVHLIPSSDMRELFPHIEFSRMLNHITVNDEDEHTFVYSIICDDTVDWQAEARFVPKVQLSKKSHGLLRAFFRENSGMVILIYLSDHILLDPEPLLAFNDRN